MINYNADNGTASIAVEGKMVDLTWEVLMLINQVYHQIGANGSTYAGAFKDSIKELVMDDNSILWTSNFADGEQDA